MSSTTLFLNQSIYEYMCAISLHEPEVMTELRSETAPLEYAVMQITPEQGQFMTLLTRLVGARRAIEIGTFTGYSTLAIAMGLPDDGQVIACDISEEWTSIGKRYWRQAGLANKIDLRLAPALETLDALVASGETASFDLAFIDADKQSQLSYYERCLELLRPGGLIMVDNVLWGGSVVDDSNQTPETCAIREFNDFLHQDQRVDISLVPIGDGLTLARKRFSALAA